MQRLIRVCGSLTHCNLWLEVGERLIYNIHAEQQKPVIGNIIDFGPLHFLDVEQIPVQKDRPPRRKIIQKRMETLR